MREPDYQSIAVEDCLPGWNEHHRTHEIPAGLIGATIVNFGSPPAVRGESDGKLLVIDFQPRGSGEVRRVVFDFDELGMWPEKELTLSATATSDAGQG